MKKQWIPYQLALLFLLGVYYYIFSVSPNFPDGRILSYTIFYIIHDAALIGYFYMNLYLSKYTLRKINYFIPIQLVIMLVSCLILSVIPYLHAVYEGHEPNLINIYMFRFFGVFLYTFLSIGFRFLQNMEEDTKKQQELIGTNHQAELDFLNSQVSPHFLLNTLNCVYGLSLKKSPDAYPAISELKNLFTYIESHQAKVTLEEEIEYLKNFIRLQQRRFGNDLDIQTEFLIDKGYLIEPLLLSTFVENAFKHGLSINEKSFIHIHLIAKQGNLEYTVQNSWHKRHSQDSVTGIGLMNLSRRLELLYPQQHEISHSHTQDSFVAYLNIQLV